MLKKIAVTGGIASGKTTVCRMFEEMGAAVCFADRVVHELLLEPKLVEILCREFGEQIVQNGQIDRKVLGKLVFKDSKKLKRLEELLHPIVLESMEQKYAKAEGLFFIAEIPLLYEIGADERFDAVVAVVADEKIAKQRFMAKGFSEEEFNDRSRRQLSAEKKAKRAHFVITNHGTLEQLREKVLQLKDELLKGHVKR
jgi:dephospho-CoA kinase